MKSTRPPPFVSPSHSTFRPHPFPALIFSPLLPPVPTSLSHLLLHPRSLSFGECPSHALALLECYRVAQCLTCTLPLLSPSRSRRVLKIVKERRGESSANSARLFSRPRESWNPFPYARAPFFADLIILTFPKEVTRSYSYFLSIGFRTKSERGQRSLMRILRYDILPFLPI